MTSKESLDDWKKVYADVVQEGKLGSGDAAKKIRLAERNVARAKKNPADDPDEALINAETAIVNSADAVLAAAGFRVRGKTRSHQARLEYPGLPGEFREMADRIERARTLRSRAMYDQADVVGSHEASELVDVARRLFEAARKFLAD